MILSLGICTVILAALFLVLGTAFFLNPPLWEQWVRTFPRNLQAGWILMGTGGLWFLYEISQLKPVDFGDYKQWLLLLFGGALVGSFFFLKDFLSVRGLAAVILMAAGPALNSAYGFYEIPQRLLFVGSVYLLIVLALYFGTVPFKARDFIAWLYQSSKRPKALGLILALSGVALLVTSFTY